VYYGVGVDVSRLFLALALVAGCGSQHSIPGSAGTGSGHNHRVNDAGSLPSDDEHPSNDAGMQSNDGGDSSNDSSVQPGDGEPHGTALLALSLREAPAPTRTFFWGEIDVSAPGFHVAPRDVLTIALDADKRLRYQSWKNLASFPKTYGDAPHEFPLTGTKQVDTHPDYNAIFQVTVEEAPEPTSSHFLLRSRNVSTDGRSDYVESTEGTRVGDGWMVVYTEKGTFFGAGINAHGTGVLYAGDPTATQSSDGSLWSAPVVLVAPGFAGPPVDHLTVALDSDGQLQSFSFERFTRRETFGTGPEALPLSGVGSRGDDQIRVDEAVAPTDSHFVIRYHVEGTAGLNSYIEGIDGTRSGDTLTIRYFIKGTLFGATIDAHAAGTLVPASSASLTDDVLDGGI
jgi:hypothetical protein